MAKFDILGGLSPRKRDSEADSNRELLDQVAKAHAQWQAALRQFAEAIDPKAVELAAFQLKSCEQQYVYLWREARRAGISGSPRFR